MSPREQAEAIVLLKRWLAAISGDRRPEGDEVDALGKETAEFLRTSEGGS